MLDEKKIEEAAKEYSKVTDCNKTEAMLVEEGFKEGAHWAIEQFLKDLWHDCRKDIPDYKPLLVIFKNGYCKATPYTTLVKEAGKKYLYIEDLLPKQKGGKG